MESNSCEKRSRNDCNNIDRISDLPDPILGQILSYLPVKNIVATSILSTRWKTLFPSSVPLVNLEINDGHQFHHSPQNNSDSDSSSSRRNFVDFVDILLNVTLRDLPCVESVDIHCFEKYGDDKIVSWVCAALRLNVKHLQLMSNLNDSVAFFDILNGCTTLVELELGYGFDLCLPEEFMLPNLKKLSLYSLLPRDDMGSIHELIDGCPVMNYLAFRGFNLAILYDLYIKHPFITKLFIEGCFNEPGCRIVIDAPNLEAFAYEGRLAANYVMKNIKSLHSVWINFDIFGEEYYEDQFGFKGPRLAKLVKACSRTTQLCLSGNSLRTLYHSGVPLPKFRNLTWLAFGRIANHGWEMLAKFLKSAPNLTILTFEEELEFSLCYAGLMSLLPSGSVCLKLRIKKIEIWDFEWTPDEIELIKYFLFNGRALQELIVHCLPCENTSDLEKLSTLPRYSKTCQVLLREKNNRGNSRYSRYNWF